jgi:hypothetical protein
MPFLLQMCPQYYEHMSSYLYVLCMAQESALLMPYFRIAAMCDESELLRADAALAVYTHTDTER